jgi:uncharacterized protein YndB with AHSA1/START domain
METKLIARSRKIIHASMNKVWEALIDPEKIKQYMVGTDGVSD